MAEKLYVNEQLRLDLWRQTPQPIVQFTINGSTFAVSGGNYYTFEQLCNLARMPLYSTITITFGGSCRGVSMKPGDRWLPIEGAHVTCVPTTSA